MQLFSAGAIAVTASTRGGGVAFMAHVAGFLTGIVGVFVFRQRERPGRYLGVMPPSRPQAPDAPQRPLSAWQRDDEPKTRGERAVGRTRGLQRFVVLPGHCA